MVAHYVCHVSVQDVNSVTNIDLAAFRSTSVPLSLLAKLSLLSAACCLGMPRSTCFNTVDPFSMHSISTLLKTWFSPFQKFDVTLEAQVLQQYLEMDSRQKVADSTDSCRSPSFRVHESRLTLFVCRSRILAAVLWCASLFLRSRADCNPGKVGHVDSFCCKGQSSIAFYTLLTEDNVLVINSGARKQL